MGILDTLLEEIKTPGEELTQQVRKICDQIMEQEKPKMKFLDIAPTGSTVFLVVESPGRYNWELGFLTLEREDAEQYIIVYHTIEKNRLNLDTPRRRKVWVINENKAKNILTQFTQKLKIIRGK